MVMGDRIQGGKNGPYAFRGELAIAGRLARGAVVVQERNILEVILDPRDGDLPQSVIDGAIIAPGLFDLQVNGGFGVEIGEDPAAIKHLAARLPETGVTSFLPTVITSAPAHYRRVFDAYASVREIAGARAIGLHLEGPFLSPRRAGAHRTELIEAANQELFEALVAFDGLRLMTLAPELECAAERIRHLRAQGVVVSLGHTDASYEQVLAGVEAGATMMTHLYNAMSPFEHRAPGAVGAGLVDDRVTVGLIADGIHCHPASVRLAVQTKGVERIALVSDMMPAAGMPPGNYELGGQAVVVDEAAARLHDGTLAGSIVTLDQAIRNVVRWTDATPAEAIRMASEVPARLLGLVDAGQIAAGCPADLVLFDKDLNVETTLINGQIVYSSGLRTGLTV
jgi:N-acetylglucosamine-6-phosphate deacetylase